MAGMCRRMRQARSRGARVGTSCANIIWGCRSAWRAIFRAICGDVADSAQQRSVSLVSAHAGFSIRRLNVRRATPLWCNSLLEKEEHVENERHHLCPTREAFATKKKSSDNLLIYLAIGL